MSEYSPALEKMNFSIFQKHFVAYRLSQIPNLILNLSDSKLQLPDRSTLHLVNHFLDQDPTASIEPDLENPFIQHEQWRKFLKFEVNVPTPDATPYPVSDRYTYMPSRYRSIIPHFFNHHKDIHNMLSDDMVDKANNILAIHEYSALLKMLLTGRLHDYRKFDITMRAILNKISNTQFPRYHFIMLPLSDRIYGKSDYLQTFSRIDMSSLKNKTDFSFYLELHILGMIYGESTPLNVTPSAYDVQYADTHGRAPWSVDVEGDDENVSPGNLLMEHSTSLFERLTPSVSDKTFLILTHGGHAIIYNIGDLKSFASSGSLFNKVVRHINTLKLIGLNVLHPEETDAMSDDQFDQVVDTHASGSAETPTSVTTTTPPPEEVKSVTSSTPITPPVTPAPKAEPMVLSEPETPPQSNTTLPQQTIPTTFMDTVHTGLKKTVESAPTQQSAHEARAQKLYETHMHTKLGGKTLAELLTPPKDTLSENTLDFMDNHLPDPAMKQSSIANYDQDYMKNLHYHDMARTLTSLVKEGMFVTDIKESLEHDQFNRIVTYKVRLVSTDGKQHNVTFKLPHVDENGFLLVNGVTAKMIKQQVNLPICKVSPTRVNLASNFNKCLVERTTSKANSFEVWIAKYLAALKKLGLVTLGYGELPITERVLPYEYTAIAQSFLTISFNNWNFNLDYDHRFDSVETVASESLTDDEIKRLKSLEIKYGTYCGTGPGDTYLFWDMKDRIHRIQRTGAHQDSVIHFVALLNASFGTEYPAPDMVSEWTELKLLDANLPIVFVLGYEFGLSNILKRINLDYKFIPIGTRVVLAKDEIKVPFSDGTMVFSRYPLVKSLVAAGLKKFDTTRYAFASMDVPDTYYSLLMDKGIRINYLKGVTAFFKFFIDPITLDVLEHMHEPTNVRDLLLRATEMLSTMDHYPASALQHHRLRGYERLSGTLYNTITRGLAQYQTQKNPRAVFSINPEDVFMRIMSDSTVQNVEVINPIHELKNNTQLTFTGSGGRTSQSFVVNDRLYPEDGVGVMSEATPDSGKVAMTVYTSANPRLRNMRGMYIPNTDDKTPVDPTQVMSVTGNLMPGLSQDDAFK